MPASRKSKAGRVRFILDCNRLGLIVGLFTAAAVSAFSLFLQQTDVLEALFRATFACAAAYIVTYVMVFVIVATLKGDLRARPVRAGLMAHTPAAGPEAPEEESGETE